MSNIKKRIIVYVILTKMYVECKKITINNNKTQLRKN